MLVEILRDNTEIEGKGVQAGSVLEVGEDVALGLMSLRRAKAADVGAEVQIIFTPAPAKRLTTWERAANREQMETRKEAK
jgi:hypothetical protein